MGGDIRVTSKVGSGSTFRVKILLSEVTNPTRIAPVDAPVFGYHGPRKTILNHRRRSGAAAISCARC